MKATLPKILQPGYEEAILMIRNAPKSGLRPTKCYSPATHFIGLHELYFVVSRWACRVSPCPRVGPGVFVGSLSELFVWGEGEGLCSRV